MTTKSRPSKLSAVLKKNRRKTKPLFVYADDEIGVAKNPSLFVKKRKRSAYNFPIKSDQEQTKQATDVHSETKNKKFNDITPNNIKRVDQQQKKEKRKESILLYEKIPNVINPLKEDDLDALNSERIRHRADQLEKIQKNIDDVIEHILIRTRSLSNKAKTEKSIEQDVNAISHLALTLKEHSKMFANNARGISEHLGTMAISLMKNSCFIDVDNVKIEESIDDPSSSTTTSTNTRKKTRATLRTTAIPIDHPREFAESILYKTAIQKEKDDDRDGFDTLRKSIQQLENTEKRIKKMRNNMGQKDLIEKIDSIDSISNRKTSSFFCGMSMAAASSTEKTRLKKCFHDSSWLASSLGRNSCFNFAQTPFVQKGLVKREQRHAFFGGGDVRFASNRSSTAQADSALSICRSMAGHPNEYVDVSDISKNSLESLAADTQN